MQHWANIEMSFKLRGLHDYFTQPACRVRSAAVRLHKAHWDRYDLSGHQSTPPLSARLHIGTITSRCNPIRATDTSLVHTTMPSDRTSFAVPVFQATFIVFSSS